MKYLLVLALGLTACGAKNDSNNNLNSQSTALVQPCPLVWGPTVLHSFGDSITWGVGASNPCVGYQAWLTTYLFYTNDNQGVSGSLMTNYHYSQMMAVQENPTDVNTVLSGFNDITNFGSDPDHLALFTQELTASLARLSTISALVVVGSQLKIPSWSLTFYNNQLALHTDTNVQLYSDAIKQVIATFNNPKIIFVDLNAVYDPYTMVAQDGQHPNDLGHGVIARAFYSAIIGAQK